MKILYIHQYFKTPNEPGGTRSYWISKKLIEYGHQVVVLTSSSTIDSKIVRKVIDGIEVVYFKVDYNQSMSFFERLWSFIRFMMYSTLYAFKLKKVDLVIATSTPLTVGFPALVLKYFKNIPYLFEVRDLWPEVPIQMGGLKNPILKNLSIFFEKTIYWHAKHIICLSPGMVNGVIKYTTTHKVSMIPNMAKVDKFWPREKNEQMMEYLGLSKNSFKVIHFGSLGIANDGMSIIHAAEKLLKDSSVQFVFIGGGSTEEELKYYCHSKRLNNVFFLGKYSMNETSEIVNFCDVSIVSFKNLPILYTNSPNKFFDSLSAGKPIIVNSAGWTKDLVIDTNCGYFVNPDRPDELVTIINKLKNDPTLCISMGNNARKLAEEKYDKNILCCQYIEVIKKIH